MEGARAERCCSRKTLYGRHIASVAVKLFLVLFDRLQEEVHVIPSLLLNQLFHKCKENFTLTGVYLYIFISCSNHNWIWMANNRFIYPLCRCRSHFKVPWIQQISLYVCSQSWIDEWIDGCIDDGLMDLWMDR